MKHIGGFFELELKRGDIHFHKDAVALSTGRACINLILSKLNPSKVYVPYYTCNATYDPFNIRNIPIEYYEIKNDLSPKSLPVLKPNEYFLYTNYFGLKTKEVEKLIKKYQSNLIIDDTHSFFKRGYPSNWSFTSARKYFGVPDGAYLYSPIPLDHDFKRFMNISIEHNLNRLIGKQEIAYKQYVEYEKTLTSEIYAMSLYSELVLSQINYAEVMEKRKINFRFYEKELGLKNKLKFDFLNDEVPFCYPFLPSVEIKRESLFSHHIYIPSLWQDTLYRKAEGFGFEKKLSSGMLPLPIDHRYDTADLSRVIEVIKTLINGK